MGIEMGDGGDWGIVDGRWSTKGGWLVLVVLGGLGRWAGGGIVRHRTTKNNLQPTNQPSYSHVVQLRHLATCILDFSKAVYSSGEP